MAAAAKLTRTFSRQFSSGAARVWRQLSLEPQRTPRRGGAAGATRFGLARQSSLDPTPAESASPLAMPENLDATMRLLYAACQGDAAGVEELLREEGVDVDSIDFDGRTALHIAACEGRGEVVRLLLGWKANINARDRWGSTGDLATYLETKGRLQSYKAIRFALDIARNIVRDDEGKLKVAGFGSLRLIKVSEDRLQMAQPVSKFDSVYIAPEIYRNETFDRSVDTFAFGLILYEMIEGSPAFHPKPQEEAAKMISSEGLRPLFKNKPKSYPEDVKQLIQECWDPTPSVRPTFSDIIVRLNKISASCSNKQTRWRDNFKLPWYSSR
ncbi:hypothetical protein ACQ4PT_019169 [Festuca glaucescens]